ncbi:MAG: S1 RNA-binding domain-containing protein, partial [Armatimonadota bacterium]|nr:S1 RNA-binding domain-containing protein [Armatimonadota bacterium]
MMDDQSEREQHKVPIHELTETPLGERISESSEDHHLTQEQSVNETDKQKEQAPVTKLQAEASDQVSDREPTQPAAQTEGVDYSGTFKSLNVGDVVDGVVVHIDHEGVLVDVGTKSEGTIKPSELSRDPNLSPEEVVSVGEKI